VTRECLHVYSMVYSLLREFKWQYEKDSEKRLSLGLVKKLGQNIAPSLATLNAALPTHEQPKPLSLIYQKLSLSFLAHNPSYVLINVPGLLSSRPPWQESQ